MNAFAAALWAEGLKARRSRVPLFTALGFSLAPVMGGLFMLILQDPERARRMGLVSAKAQLAGGAADWPTYLGVLGQATAVGGALLFSLVTAWVFGREFVDGTAKELLAVPTRRETIVGAKFVVIGAWAGGLTACILWLGLAIGAGLALPGGSVAVLGRAAADLAVTAVLVLGLMPAVALLASAGRGYLPALGWAILTLFLAQILAATGWGDWFPWSVPALFSGMAGPRTAHIGIHSYAVVALTCVAGTAGTFAWWRTADHAG